MAQFRTIPSPARQEDTEAFGATTTRHQTQFHQATVSLAEASSEQDSADAGSPALGSDAPSWPLLEEILDIDPAKLNERPLGEWRRLHEQFFTRLADLTALAGVERQALESVLSVVNKQTPPLCHKPLNEEQHQAWVAGKRKELAAMGLNEFPPIRQAPS